MRTPAYKGMEGVKILEKRKYVLNGWSRTSIKNVLVIVWRREQYENESYIVVTPEWYTADTSNLNTLFLLNFVPY